MISSEVPPYDISGAKKRKRSAIEVTESLTRANPVEYEDPYERLDGALQRAWTSVMDQDGHYKTSPFYRKVKCLLISWHKDCDDLDTEEEVSLAMPWGWIQLINQVSKLGSLLETKFNYKVKRALLGHDPRHDPFLQVTRSIVDFIWEEDGPNSLLMVYYAGHGAPKPRRGGRYDGLTLTSARNVNEDDDEEDNDIVWSKIEEHFQGAKADVLEIFDCCYAGDVSRSRLVWGSRSFEYLGACSSGNVTRKPGPGSFTTALIWALDRLRASQGRFTVSELSSKIRDAPAFPRDQVPVQFDRAPHSIERIVLTPLSGTSDAPTNDAQNGVATTFDDTTFQGLLHLNFIFTEPPTMKIIEKLAKSLNRAMKVEKMPVSRIAWGGLSSWEDPQVTANGRAFMIKAASKFRKAVANKKLKRG